MSVAGRCLVPIDTVFLVAGTLVVFPVTLTVWAAFFGQIIGFEERSCSSRSFFGLLPLLLRVFFTLFPSPSRRLSLCS